VGLCYGPTVALGGVAVSYERGEQVYVTQNAQHLTLKAKQVPGVEAEPEAQASLPQVLQGSGFRFQGTGYGVQRSAFSVQGARFRVQGSGFRVQGSGFRVQGSGFSVQGSGFRVRGSGFRVQDLGLSREHKQVYHRSATPTQTSSGRVFMINTRAQ